jgi:hypothetical protein
MILLSESESGFPDAACKSSHLCITCDRVASLQLS